MNYMNPVNKSIIRKTLQKVSKVFYAEHYVPTKEKDVMLIKINILEL